MTDSQVQNTLYQKFIASHAKIDEIAKLMNLDINEVTLALTNSGKPVSVFVYNKLTKFFSQLTSKRQ